MRPGYVLTGHISNEINFLVHNYTKLSFAALEPKKFEPTGNCGYTCIEIDEDNLVDATLWLRWPL